MPRLKSGHVLPSGLMLLLLTGCQHASPPAAGGLDASLTSQEINLANFDHTLLARAVFEETNRVRVAHAVPALNPMPELDEAADYQASYLALQLRLDHRNPFPGEHTPTERVTHNGIHPEAVGENAEMQPALKPADTGNRNYTYGEFAAFLVDGWMNSPQHRAILLDPTVTNLGCAARLSHGASGEELVFATQVFALFKPKPTAADMRHG